MTTTRVSLQEQWQASFDAGERVRKTQERVSAALSNRSTPIRERNRELAQALTERAQAGTNWLSSLMELAALVRATPNSIGSREHRWLAHELSRLSTPRASEISEHPVMRAWLGSEHAAAL